MPTNATAAMQPPPIVSEVRPQPIWNPLRYDPRSCRFLGIGRCGAASYKLYLIRSGNNADVAGPRVEDLHAVVAAEFAGWDSPTDHPLGFVIAHLADDGWYLLLSRWNNANNLRHRVRALELGPGGLGTRAMDDAEIIACVWELRLVLHEVDAWIASVLLPPRDAITPDAAEAYLAARYEGPL